MRKPGECQYTPGGGLMRGSGRETPFSPSRAWGDAPNFARLSAASAHPPAHSASGAPLNIYRVTALSPVRLSSRVQVSFTR